MNEFLDKLSKIRSDYFKRMQFLFIIDLISIFSIFFAIFTWLQVNIFLEHFSLFPSFIPIFIITPILAFIIAIIGAFLLHRNDHKKNVTLIIENKYPELREKLRTAYDNRNESNVIVESLKSLVSSGLTIVSASRLVAAGIVVTKIIVVIIFISAATYIEINPDFRAPPDTLTNAYTNISKTITGTTGIGNETTLLTVGQIQGPPTAGSQGGGNIIGKPKIASLQGKNIDLTLYQSSSSGFTPTAQSQQLSQFMPSTTYPVDIVGSNVSDGGYSILMQKSEADKTLIQNYAISRI